MQVTLAESYLEDRGVAWKGLTRDDRALLVCQNLWLEMLNLEPEKYGEVDLGHSLEFQKGLGVSGCSGSIGIQMDNKGG